MPVYGMARGYSVGHSLFESAPLVTLAALGSLHVGNRRIRSAMVSLGLLTASAVAIHLSGGVIVAHFFFFVMIVLLTLYEDWLPFGLAVGYVVFHHGVVGALDPGSVYNHGNAVAHPWRWAAIHGAFVSAAGVAPRPMARRWPPRGGPAWCPAPSTSGRAGSPRARTRARATASSAFA